MQAELETLHEELEVMKSGRKGKRRIRRTVVAILVVLLWVPCLVVLDHVVWARRTVLNTDTFVATVGPVFEHPEVDGGSHPGHRPALRPTPSADSIEECAAGQGQPCRPDPSPTPPRATCPSNWQRYWDREPLTEDGSPPSPPHTRSWWPSCAVRRPRALSTSGGYIVLNTVPVINNALGQVSGLASRL